MERLEELRETLDEEGFMDRNTSLQTRYVQAIKNDKVRKIMELETPQVTDLTDVLQIENDGRLLS